MAAPLTSNSSLLDQLRNSDGESPVIFLLLFHKAIKCELDALYRAAFALANDGEVEVGSMWTRSHFLFSVIKHHSNAEDEVIFSALDKRAKNVVRAYFLEHEGDDNLFRQLFEFLNSNVQNSDNVRRNIALCVGAIHTSLLHHMFKEEDQVFTLLLEKFSHEELGELVWQFLCSIPVNIIAELLPWISSCISDSEHNEMIRCLFKIVPQDLLLQQVILTWLRGKSSATASKGDNDDSLFGCHEHMPCKSSHSIAASLAACRYPATWKRRYKEPYRSTVDSSGIHPIDDILNWHNAMRKEVNDIAQEAERIRLSSDFTTLSTLVSRLEFITNVCIHHSIAEEQIIFPAVDAGISFVKEHAEEEKIFNKVRCLVKHIQCTTIGPMSADEICSSLCSHADQINSAIHRHFSYEEDKVLPFARKYLSAENQRKLLYKSLCVMPLNLIKCALPWLVASLSEKEARLFIQNMKFAASSSETALVTLFSAWACKDRLPSMEKSGTFIFLASKQTMNQTPKAPASLYNESSSILTEKGKKLVDLCSLEESCGTVHEISRVGYDFNHSCKQIYCAPGLTFKSTLQTSSISNCCNSSMPPIKSSLFSLELDNSQSDVRHPYRPIDIVFQFHKAIRKYLEYLDKESEKLVDCDETFLQQFNGTFCLFWRLYKAHSGAEDRFIFPVVESREALHNLSYSYSLDHKQAEILFADISVVLSQLSLHYSHFLNAGIEAEIIGNNRNPSMHFNDVKKKHNELVTKLQSMSKSMRVTLERHVSIEELELWPLFELHFSYEEQEKIIGRIIGNTGAEVLQSMLQWVTSALNKNEQDMMMETWREATKNTMFSEWLNEWWIARSVHSSAATIDVDLEKGTLQQEKFNEGDQISNPLSKDIFQMNQNEFESEVRRVYSDQSLDPKRKAHLIQNLMTSGWLATQKKLSQRTTEKEGDIIGCSPSYRDPEKQVFGCEHYKRNCKLVAACCEQLFTCRFCHDKVSDHLMDRKATTKMMCMLCLKVQPVSPTCKTPSCNGVPMAKYFCKICNLFDDERNVYHCPFCNLCRVGKGLGIDFFHCMKCNNCLGMTLVEHECKEKSLERNCPICCEFLFTSSAPIRALKCGHFMHSACYKEYVCSHYTCPICSKTMGDMTVYFGMLDALLAAEQLPEEYQNCSQDILCNDCNKKGTSPFHWLHHKCRACGSYNTRVIRSEDNNCSTSSLVD